MVLCNLLLLLVSCLVTLSFAELDLHHMRPIDPISTTHGHEHSQNGTLYSSYGFYPKKAPSVVGEPPLREVHHEQHELTYNNKAWIFYVFDTNYDNKISSSELANFYKYYMNESLSDEEIAQYMSFADTGGDGYISFDEFIVALSKQGKLQFDPVRYLLSTLELPADTDDDQALPGAPRVIPHPLPPPIVPDLQKPTVTPSFAPSAKWDDGKLSAANGVHTTDQAVQTYSATTVAAISAVLLVFGVVIAVPYAIWKYRRVQAKSSIDHDFSGTLDGKPSLDNLQDVVVKNHHPNKVQRQPSMSDLRLVSDSIEEGDTLDTIPSPVPRSPQPAASPSPSSAFSSNAGYSLVDGASSHPNDV